MGAAKLQSASGADNPPTLYVADTNAVESSLKSFAILELIRAAISTQRKTIPNLTFSSLTMLVGRQKGHPASKNF